MMPIDDPNADQEVMVDINTTPLVDVLLVLLVMLIITIPIQLHSVSLEMPGLQGPPPPKDPEIVQVEVLPGGALLWNGEAVETRAALDEKLQAASANGAERQPEIHLRPHSTAKYEHVAAVLASAQRAGLVKIGLVGSEQFAP